MKPETIEKKIVVFKWLCNECGKVIESQYLNQFKYNKEQHLKKHEKKEAKK